LALLALLLLSGCTKPDREPGVPLEDVAGESVQKRPIHYWVFGTKGPVVLYIGALRGNEASGTPLLMMMMSHLLTRPQFTESRRAVFVPFANPDGVKLGRKANANGIDLDRDFTGFTQPETQALRKLMKEYPPAVVVDVRRWQGRVQYHGPGAEDLARRVATRTGMPARDLEAPGGSLREYGATVLKVPVLTLELPPEARNAADWLLFDQFGAGLMTALLSVRGPD
jgi:hypothetical protein